MSVELAYSQKQLTLAVNLAALLGWACVAVPMAMQSDLGVLLLAAIFGLPIAFLCCWVIGAPILRYAMRREIGGLEAMGWGGVIALLIALVGIAIKLFLGMMESANPNSHSQIGGGDYVQEIDGILTAYGWLVLGRSTMIFVGEGVCVALFVWWVIGKPISRGDQQVRQQQQNP